MEINKDGLAANLPQLSLDSGHNYALFVSLFYDMRISTARVIVVVTAALVSSSRFIWHFAVFKQLWLLPLPFCLYLHVVLFVGLLMWQICHQSSMWLIRR